MTHDRRLIEDSLPLEAISFQSAREKSIRHGHISTLHIWWARRPLAAMRAAIFASLIPAPESEEERQKLHKLIGGTYNGETGKWEGGICDWDSVKDGNSPVIEEAKRLIAEQYPDAPPKVLDPFMGGGSTGLEALRLGCEAHGVELNPVAYLIELCTLVYPQKYGQPIPRGEYEARPGTLPSPETDTDGQQAMDFDTDEMINPLAEDVRRWGNWVLEEARKEIGHLYEDPEGRTIVGYLWARTAKCPNPQCGAEMPMVRQWWLAKTPDRKVAIRPVVDHLSKTVSFEIAENDDIDFDPSDGTMRRGSIRCLVCDQSPDIDHLREEGRSDRLHAMPMAVIYEHLSRSGKGYRTFTELDNDRYEAAERRLADYLSEDPESIPTDPIPLMSGTFNAPIYGLDQWAKLFNKRQSVALVTFVRKVREAHFRIAEAKTDQHYARAIVTYLSLLIDRLADYNSTICLWHSPKELVAHTFGRQALPMVWDYVEINPFSGSTGNWAGATDWVLRVVEHSASAALNTAVVRQGNATRLPLMDKEITAVITDPPYYNAVPYADLSDFFYVWLRRTLSDLHSEIFLTPLAPKTAEITEMAGWDPDRYAHKDKLFYETNMTQAFTEAQRVLEDEGVFVVVFAHKSTAAWETLINSLLQAGLVVTASWPLHTEMGTRLRARDSAALASSIFIVCRKRTADTEGFYDDVQADLRAHITERLDFFWKQGIRGADFFISAIGPAVSVFGQYRQVRKLTGEVVTAAELLDLVQELVSDYALGKVMNGRYRMGGIDAPTRFYVMYRWSYGAQKIPFDDARRLAQALGAEVDELMHRRDMLKQSGEDVTLRGPLDRDDEHLGETGRDGFAAPLIDIIHRAVLLWRASDRRALAEFLSEHAQGREDSLRAVAQALANVLPDGDRERQLVEGFLTGQDSLPDVPHQGRLF